MSPLKSWGDENFLHSPEGEGEETIELANIPEH